MAIVNVDSLKAEQERQRSFRESLRYELARCRNRAAFGIPAPYQELCLSKRPRGPIEATILLRSGDRVNVVGSKKDILSYSPKASLVLDALARF